MGADLYIEKLEKTRTHGGFEVSNDARMDGYFRDCYNGGGIFSVMSVSVPGADLSWWITKRRKELFRKKNDRFMKVSGSKTLLSELEPIVKKFLKLKKLYYFDYCMKKRKGIKGEKIKQCRIKEYHDWATGLLDYLRLAIKLRSGIRWSV